MNSILQCILATPYLNSWFLDDYKKATQIRSQRLSEAYYDLIKEAKSSTSNISPTDLKYAVAKSAP